MVLAMRIAVGLIGVFFLVMGMRFMVEPEAMAAQFFIDPLGFAGLSTVRGDIGGAFLAVATLIFLGLGTGVGTWLRAAAILIGAFAFGRALGFLLDRSLDADVLLPFSLEVAFVVLILIANRRLTAKAGTP